MYLHVYYVTKRKWTKILSHLVRLFQGSEHDHAGFGFSVMGDEPQFVQEASLKGVVQTPFQEFIDNHSYVVAEFKIPVTPEEREAIAQMIKGEIGKKYSVWQLVGNAFAIVMKRCFNYIVKKNPFRNGDAKYICAEYLAKALVIVGGVLPEKYNLETIDVTHCFEMNKQIEKSIRMK